MDGSSCPVSRVGQSRLVHLFPRKPAIFASAIDETGGRSSPIKKRSGGNDTRLDRAHRSRAETAFPFPTAGNTPEYPGCSLCARRRQAPALITVFGPAGTPLALQRLVGKFVGADALAVCLHAFKLVSRCEDARPEGDQRGANSASPRTHGSVRTRASGDPDAVGNPERGTQTTDPPASGSCARPEFGRRLLP